MLKGSLVVPGEFLASFLFPAYSFSCLEAFPLKCQKSSCGLSFKSIQSLSLNLIPPMFFYFDRMSSGHKRLLSPSAAQDRGPRKFLCQDGCVQPRVAALTKHQKSAATPQHVSGEGDSSMFTFGGVRGTTLLSLVVEESKQLILSATGSFDFVSHSSYEEAVSPNGSVSPFNDNFLPQFNTYLSDIATRGSSVGPIEQLIGENVLTDDPMNLAQAHDGELDESQTELSYASYEDLRDPPAPPVEVRDPSAPLIDVRDPSAPSTRRVWTRGVFIIGEGAPVKIDESIEVHLRDGADRQVNFII